MRSLFVAAAGAAALLTVPAAAQETAAPAPGGERISQLIVFGDDPCPQSTGDEIVVCARKPEGERYRIPERLRQGGSLQSRQAWAARAKQFEVVGRTGINSCSPVGPGGFTGCTEQLIKQAFTEREEQVQSDTAPKP